MQPAAADNGETDELDAPIYAGLVRELGDVPADARHAVQVALKQADPAAYFGTSSAPR
ncbi:hypothetical protein [Streptomyces sp. S1D4-20]|uniref:hypothetical protein n=1 Tax=Streptomyces sp. S1D4-20 TaxID=2594462 RepID=UPI0013DE8628|nr:hypothetical protein [Streptomyces sp. S1D4-20]